MKDKTNKHPSNEFDAAIGRNVQSLLDARGLKHRHLSEILDYNSTGSISELLAGKRRWNTDFLMAICNHFQCSAASLLFSATAQDRNVSLTPHQAQLISAYYAASDRDRAMVDLILFPSAQTDAQKKPDPKNGRSKNSV